MNKPTVIVTGAAGLLGSAVAVDLARDCDVYGIDIRAPNEALRRIAPGIQWHVCDIAEATALERVFDAVKAAVRDRQDIFVVHFAAYYHFGVDGRADYERTNIEGTKNVLNCAQKLGVKRVLFASSLLALEPAEPGKALKESTPATGWTPYAVSKIKGEELLTQKSSEVPGAILRIGGIFTDWCELPPLYSLMGMWAGGGLLSRILVGKGITGIPYLHRVDLVSLVRKVLERHEKLNPLEIFLCCQHGTVTHVEIFSSLLGLSGRTGWFCSMPIWFAELGLRGKCLLGGWVGRMPYERPWMLKYADRPWVADTTCTRKRLDWSPRETFGVLDRLPILLERFQHARGEWDQRNKLRNERKYAYAADDVMA